MSKKKIVEINPFVVNNPIKVLSVNSKGVIADNPKDGVVYEGDILHRKYYIDQQKKTSVYRHNNDFMNDFLFNKLNSKGRDVYLYIIHHLPENQDYMELRIEKIKSATGISRNSIVTALKELKVASLISPKSRSMYWINPEFMFNGNRINYYRAIQEELVETVGNINR